jgi:enoyl-CoA hydratase/carnithine racemase
MCLPYSSTIRARAYACTIDRPCNARKNTAGRAPCSATALLEQMDDDRLVVSSHHSRVCLVELNRPTALNAWVDDSFHHMRECLEAAAADASIAVVVITGRGRAFSAGADMKEMGTNVESGGGEGDEIRASSEPIPADPADSAFGRCLRAVTDFPKPLVAAVNGVGVGWGMTILGHCDFVFMSNSARLRTPFTQLGLTAEAASSITFAMKMGWQNAAHVLMSSEWFSAEEAKELGLVFKVTEPEALLEETMAYAERLAAQPIDSLVATKRLMLGGGRTEAVMSAHHREMAAFSRLMGSPANREAVRAFAEKRAPDFSKL